LEDVSVVIPVVGDHVHQENPGYLRRRQVNCLLSVLNQLQLFFNDSLAEMPGTQAIGRELFPGQVQQPDILLEVSCLGKFQINGCRLQECGGGRVIVIRTGSRGTRPAPATRFIVQVFHISGVVMVSQDDGLRAVFPGDHDQDITFMQLIFLVAFLPSEERKVKVRFPVEGNFAAKRLAFHAGLADRFPVAGDQIIAQPVQVPQRARGLTLDGRILDTIGVVFISIFPLGQRFNVVPVRRLELPVGSVGIGQRLGQWSGLSGFFQQ